MMCICFMSLIIRIVVSLVPVGFPKEGTLGHFLGVATLVHGSEISPYR